jgi:hypothetical protein
MRRWIAFAASLLLTATFGSAPVLAQSTSSVIHPPRIALLTDKNPHGGGSGSGFGWASSNWSGYAITGSGLTSVTGTWVVPTVSSSTGSTYSSSWIGIDGFNNSSLIQTGTEQDFVSGQAVYYAWWEILPASETVITSITVHPRDVMSASIAPSGTPGMWVITIADGVQVFTTTRAYSGPQTSAEWIEEAPSIGGRVATLAHYGTAKVDPGTAKGASPGLLQSNGGVMIQQRMQVSTPSLPDSENDGFNVSYGSSVPASPGS